MLRVHRQTLGTAGVRTKVPEIRKLLSPCRFDLSSPQAFIVIKLISPLRALCLNIPPPDPNPYQDWSQLKDAKSFPARGVLHPQGARWAGDVVDGARADPPV